MLACLIQLYTVAELTETQSVSSTRNKKMVNAFTVMDKIGVSSNPVEFLSASYKIAFCCYPS